jgi:metal-responsive CopG/Arc/MetJ family transcriptional regulator
VKRISVTIPDELAEALERAVEVDPSKPSKSRVVSEALARYLAWRYPETLARGHIKGPSVLAALKSARPRAPSPTLRRSRLRLPKWAEVEG